MKTGCSFKLLTVETMKLCGITTSKKNKDKNGENFFHLKSTEVLLVDCSIRSL